MSQVTLKVKRLPHCYALPQYATSGAAGLDLCAALEEELTLHPGDRVRIPTGVQVEIPPGFQAQVVPRSGLADRNGITLTNSPGTIDSDYRGEVQCLVINHGREPYTFKRGDRIGQMVLVAIPQVELVEVQELATSERGAGGFGSSGRNWLSDYKGQV
ncbi:MAG TPA: dUTP diphosphatase [Planktothrix sp.]|jgi:dUTP pyrophosphatase